MITDNLDAAEVKKFNELIKELILECGFSEAHYENNLEDLAGIDKLIDYFDTVVGEHEDDTKDKVLSEIPNDDDVVVGDNIVEEMNIPLLKKLKSLDYLTLKKIVDDIEAGAYEKINATTEKVKKEKKEKTVKEVKEEPVAQAPEPVKEEVKNVEAPAPAKKGFDLF